MVKLFRKGSADIAIKKQLPHAAAMLLIIGILFPGQPAVFAADNSETEYNNLIKLKKSDKELYINSSTSFIKKFPASSHTPLLMLEFADAEHNADKSEKSYLTILTNYPNFKNGDYVYWRLAELYYFKNRWQDLTRYTTEALQKYPNSRYAVHIRLYQTYGALATGNIELAQTSAASIRNAVNSPMARSWAELYNSSCERKVSGYSRAYLLLLVELYSHGKESEVLPSVLYLFHDYYYKQGKFNEALGSLVTLNEKFPRSPEAMLVTERIAELKNKGAKPVTFLPDEKMLQGSDELELYEDIPLQNNNTSDNGISYAVAVGPLLNLQRALELKNMLGNDFGPVDVITIKNGYMVYIGATRTAEDGQNIKIRLAEEFGFNSSVVRRSKKNDREYIYGD